MDHDKNKPDDKEAQEDDISIDFSKIKGFFSGKDSKHVKEHNKNNKETKNLDVEEDKEKKSNLQDKVHDKSLNDKDSEEDVEIDFSKIKNFFSGKDKKPREHTAEHHEKHHDSAEGDEENIDFDFSNARKFFSNDKRNKILLTTLLILIPVILTIFIRLQPQYLPATDAWAENSMENYYKNSIAQQVDTQYPNLPSQQRQALVNDQFSQFKKANQNDLKNQIKQTSEYFKTGFRYEENNKQYTFLGDLDSYYYLRQATNLNNKGTICDEIREGKCIDNHMVAPLGLNVETVMHPYGIVYLYKFLHFFSPSVNLMQAQFYLPTLLAVIAAIAAFFIGRRLMNDVAGFFAAMFLALSPLFITRTLGSDTDIWNIMFPLIILWIFLEAYESRNLMKKIVLGGVAGLFIGLFSFAWSGWWYIFLFILVAVAAYLVFEVIKNYLMHKHISKTITKELLHNGLIFLLLIVSSGIFVSLFTSFQNFSGAITAPLHAASTLKIATHSNLWPNVYTTVAELNEADIGSIVGQLSFGTPIIFALALLGIIFTMIKKKPDFKEYILIGISAMVYFYLISSGGLSISKFTYMLILALPVTAAVIMLLREKESAVDVKPAFLLTIWFLGMIFASTKGVRFILLLIPAFSIALGVTIGYIYQYFTRWLMEDFKIRGLLAKVSIFVILCLILISPIKIGIDSGKSFVPSITKGWYDSLIKIRDESKPDAIINSWWDFGHWFKYYADRRVTADGASQNTPQAHWLGRILQTNNEKEAIAILRMLDCGANTFFEKINEKYMDTEVSQNVVKQAIMMDKAETIDYLASLGFDNAEELVQYSHCDPPENYFITSEDMVGKAGVWAHFGLWDFDKAFIISNAKPKPLLEAITILKERFNYSDEEATRIYYDVQSLSTDRQMNDYISPWPGYAMSTAIGCPNKEEIVQCSYNMGLSNNGQTTVVLERALINISSPENSQIVLGFYDQSGNRLQESLGAMNELVIMDNTTKKYKSTNATIGLSALLASYKQGNETIYRSLIADPLLIDSMFTRLFYLDGKNIKHFEKFSDMTDITGTRIIVWKVKW